MVVMFDVSFATEKNGLNSIVRFVSSKGVNILIGIKYFVQIIFTQYIKEKIFILIMRNYSRLVQQKLNI